MRIAFGLGHPAHFHLYKNVMSLLRESNEVDIYISDKDILRRLLDLNGLSYVVIANSQSDENILAKAKKLFLSTRILYKSIKSRKPDIFVSCLPQLSWVCRILKSKNIFNAEDDITYTYLQGFITYPFVNTILTSEVVKTWPFTFKQIGYAGYHKLAYLHPNWFTPDDVIKSLYIKDGRYFIIRLVNQNAYHDIRAKGLDKSILKNVIDYLKDFGTVYISSEKALPEEFKKYALIINENHLHHILFYADLFIGDSQSMTVEAAMLGTPSIRINNFANKISIIKEIEHTYKLTYSINPKETENLIMLIKNVLSVDREVFRVRRKLMLEEKIDVTTFMAWFIKNYPNSVKIMESDPSYQYRFK